jgi:hypothetical protein
VLLRSAARAALRDRLVEHRILAAIARAPRSPHQVANTSQSRSYARLVDGASALAA